MHNIWIALECEHTGTIVLPGIPKVGTQLYCNDCQGLKSVVSAEPAPINEKFKPGVIAIPPATEEDAQ